VRLSGELNRINEELLGDIGAESEHSLAAWGIETEEQLQLQR